MTSGPVHMWTRTDAECLRFSGMEVLVRTPTGLDGSALTVVEEVDPIDVPLHIHNDRDELFYVLEGEHLLTVGTTRYHVGPGDLVVGPRGVPHAQQRVVPRVGRILEIFVPGGFEGFFRELAVADARDAPGEEFLAELAAGYGVQWV